jgi:beta-mannosidase
LPPIVERLDGTRLYWPSSPYGANDHNSAEEGDRHNWQVWHGAVFPRRFGEEPKRELSPEGISYRHYAEDPARFISEFGMHAAPVLETLRRNVPAAALHLDSPELLYRNKDEPKDKANMLLLAHTGLPNSLQEYLDFSMICQAEGLKFGIEHYRRRKFHCSGTLFWQWNDCWPGLSWSVLDYHLFPKASYFYVKRAYAPVLASFKGEVDGVSLWITNDTLEDFRDAVTIFHGDFSGQELYEEVLEVRATANSSVKVRHLSFDQLAIRDPRQEYLLARSRSGSFRDNRYFFAEVKELKHPKANLTVKITEGSHAAYEVRVAADSYAYFVKLVVPAEGTRFSDNYFDLFPGQERTIQVWNDADRRLEENDIAVSCLWQS